MRIMIICVAISCLFCISAFAGEIITVDGESIKKDDISIAEKDSKLFAIFSKEGQEHAISCDDIVRIIVNPDIALSPANVKLTFTNGDYIYGTLIDGSDGSVSIANKFLGDIKVKNEYIHSLEFISSENSLPLKTSKSEDSDVLILANGDQDKGIVSSISANNVTFQSTQFNTTRAVEIKDISAIYFAALGRKPNEQVGLLGVVVAQDGSTVRGKIKSYKEGTLTIETLYGATYTIAAISNIYFKNGRVTYLSDIEPTTVKENANYIRLDKPLPSDLSFPYKKDTNVKGSRISIRNTAFEKGLGVHSQSILTYSLGGKYNKFTATIGIDDIAEGKGSVAFLVYVDGKKIYDSGVVTGADKYKEISINIKGADKLKLMVDFGEDLPTAISQGRSPSSRDYADWADARVIR